MEHYIEYHTVQDLINHLEELGKDRVLLFTDSETKTAGSITSDVFRLWKPDDPESPVMLRIDKL